MIKLILALLFVPIFALASVTVSVNGSNHTIPQTNERGWGNAVTGWIQAISQYTLQPSGGTFTLGADVDFGASFGIKPLYVKTRTASPSTAGVLRLAVSDTIGWRNTANGGNLLLAVNGSDQLTFNGAALTSSTGGSFQDSTFGIYDNGDATKIIGFQASGISTGTTRTITMPDSNVDLGGLVNANLASGAAIARSKIAVGTASHIIVNDGSGNLSSSATLARALVANGTADHVLINSGAGALSSEATLAKSRGGAGADMSSVTFPSTGTLATLAGSETFTNKVLTSPTVNSPTIATPTIDVITLDGQGSTPANPSAGFYKAYVEDASGKMKLLDSGGNVSTIGSSSGLKNYITYPDAESGTTGWAAYADAAGVRPVDGTGGSPSSTWTTSTSTPLAGSNDYRWTKSANNRQGEGVSYAFSIDKQDQGKPLQIEFNWKLVSGTWAGSVAPATDSDMIVYIYDVTNTTMIEPQGRLLEQAVTGQFYRYRGTFQTSINSTSYRLIFHTASTSASAYTLGFDEFRVGPQVVSNGAVKTDPLSYSVSFNTTAFDSPTNKVAYWQRDGGDLIVYGSCSPGGSVSNAPWSISLPSGLSIDTTKLSIPANALDAAGTIVGDWSHTSSGSSGRLVTAPGTSTVLVYAAPNFSGSNTNLPQSASGLIGNSGTFSFSFRVPILGWSSNVQMSSDSDTRVMASRMYYAGGNGGTSVTAGDPMPFEATEYDTHGANTLGASAKFTAQTSGFYLIDVRIQESANNVEFFIYKGGVSFRKLGQAEASGAFGVSDIIYLKAGEYIDIRCASTITIYGTGHAVVSNTSMSLHRLSGPSQVAANETIAATAYGTATGGSGAGVTIVFPTESFDTHGAYNPATGEFTAPTSGYYKVNVNINASASVSIYSYVDGVQGAVLGYLASNGSVSGTVRLNAGQVLTIRPDGSLGAFGPANSLSIDRK